VIISTVRNEAILYLKLMIRWGKLGCQSIIQGVDKYSKGMLLGLSNKMSYSLLVQLFITNSNVLSPNNEILLRIWEVFA